MLKKLFCEDISVEYEFKSVKFKGIVDRLIMNTWKHNGIQNITDAPTFTSIYIDLYIRDEPVKICRFKTLWVRIFARGTLLLFEMFRYTC